MLCDFDDEISHLSKTKTKKKKFMMVGILNDNKKIYN
jgi:hypothetical protein